MINGFNPQRKKILSISITTFALANIVAFIGHGCSKMGDARSYSASAPSATGTAGTDSITIFPNTKTVSTVYAKQFLDNMVSCTGLGIESARTRGEWENRRGSLSEYGYATEVTPPMLMAIAAIGGEICSDLIAKEKSASNRTIFEGFNLSGQTTTTEVNNAIQRMALSCWNRRASNEEVNVIQNMVTEAAENADGEQSALLLCTSMLASYKSFEM